MLFLQRLSLGPIASAVGLASFFIMSLNSCKQDKLITLPNANMNYVSNNVGRWIIYDCDSIYYPEAGISDTVRFQIREQIDSLGIDGENQQIQNLSRYIRANDTLPWTFLVRWTSKITGISYQKVENNIRYIKLGFPISNSEVWNGNAYNSLGEEDYYYGSFNVPGSFGSFNFDSTLTVIQGDSTIGFQNYPYGIEMYATGLGMFYHFYAAVDFYPGSTAITDGLQYYERMNSYGHF